MTKIVDLKDAITLDDVQACTELAGVRELFGKLGYTLARDGAPLNKADFAFAPADDGAIDRLYRVAHCENHVDVFLLRGKPERTAPRLLTRIRSITQSLIQRGPCLLLFTEQYPFTQLLWVNPFWADASTAQPQLHLRKLLIDTRHPTPFDLNILRRCAARGHSPTQVYLAQCEAFDPELIAEEFYREYAVLSLGLENKIRVLNRDVPEFRKQVLLRAFTQRLLRHVVLAYLLQKKLWLGGDPDFLTTWYHRIVYEQGKAYYRDWLEKILFETLNQRRFGDDSPWGKLPYISGDLLRRDYPPMVELPNELFHPHDREAILGFFNRCTWTVEQHTADEYDVGVGLDLLGKAMERWLIGEENYTPAAILRHLCRTTLVNHLHADTQIDRALLREQFDRVPKRWLTVPQADAVEKALRDIRVLDPAVRAGRCLTTLMQEMSVLVRACQHARGAESSGKSMADWKREWLTHCLFGVDADREAIELTRWQLSLSLVLDSPREGFEPLPYLEDNLVRGNLLIETLGGQPILATADDRATMPDVQMGLAISETEQTATKLRELKKQYVDANPAARVELRREMQQIENQIVLTYLRERQTALELRMKALLRKGRQVQWKDAQERRQLELLQSNLLRISELMQGLIKGELPPPFLYRLHWSHVLQEKNGFDIVVGNVLGAQGHLSRDQRLALQYEYPNLYDARADSAIYYYARCLELVRNNGTLALISSSDVLRGRHLHRLELDQRATWQAILLLEQAEDIESVAVILQKQHPTPGHFFQVYTLSHSEMSQRQNLAAYPAQMVAQAELMPPRPTEAARRTDEDSGHAQTAS